MHKRPHLHALADRLGIIPSFVDNDRKRRFTFDSTRAALIQAMGFDASTERAAERSLRGMIEDKLEAVHNVPSVVVWRRGLRAVPLCLPEPLAEPVPFRAEFRVQQKYYVVRGTLPPSRLRMVTVQSPRNLPRGDHSIWLHYLWKGRPHVCGVYLIVVPRQCWTLDEAIGKRQADGVCANLYSIRSERNWGVGDLTDLKKLIKRAGGQGEDFVGLNPLHALRNRRPEVSPYSPVSRHYGNPIYIDVEAVPEFEHCEPAGKLLRSTEFADALRRVRSSDAIDYDSVYDLKLRTLRLLHREFLHRHGTGQTARGRAYANYVFDRGHLLGEFATFCALDDHFRTTKRLADWRDWPSACHSVHSTAVARFRERNQDVIGFNCFLQFELDRQSGECAKLARRHNLALGLYHDVAVGSAAGGFDTWAHGRLFARDVTVGCPPDVHSRDGQNWSFPPINPHVLEEHGYWYWREVLNQAMRHAGMVRIDHAMGLMRQFWIPKGRPASEGAYVRYPFDALVGLIAKASRRHKVVVVGEDLGTVPPGFSAKLHDRGILSTRVMFFERTRSGGFKRPWSNEKNAITSATTHDLPPLAGWWEGTDLKLRRDLTLIKGTVDWKKALSNRERDRKALLRALRAEGLIDKRQKIVSVEELRDAVHKFLKRTPSKLIAYMLDDLALETEPINLPGVGPDQHASWTRRMGRPLGSS